MVKIYDNGTVVEVNRIDIFEQGRMIIIDDQEDPEVDAIDEQVEIEYEERLVETQ